MRVPKSRLALYAALAAATGFPLSATAGARVPSTMIGTWAHGSCSDPASRLRITAATAALGTGKPAAIYYDANDGGSHAALHWRQEYNVDNFVYVRETKRIVHNTQGFGMPGAVVYKRCTGERRN